MDALLQPAYRYRCLVTRVVDGDTVYLDLDLGCGVWLLDRSVRLLGINAREKRGVTAGQGKLDSNHLQTLITTHALSIRELKKLDEKVIAWELVIETKLDKKSTAEGDKYGRLLGTLLGQQNGVVINLNNQMLADGFAVPAPVSW